MTKEQRREIILTKPILPLLVRMAIPTIIGMLVTMIYNLTDTFFIGQLGNKSMTAAIGIAFSFVSFIQALGAVILTILSMHNGNIPVRLHRVSLRNGRLYHILVGGAPNFSRQGITSIAAILLNILAADYGEETIAALTIAGRVAALFYMVMIGWGQGFQPVCAMNYGARQYTRVKKALKLSTAIGSVFLIAATFVLAIFAEPLSAIFSKNPEVIALCTRILRLQCISLPFMGVYALSSMFTQNIGKYFTALLISISRQGLFYIPLLYLLPPLFTAMGSDAMTGLFCVQPAADIASFVFGGSVMLWCLRRIQVRSFHGPFL